MQDVSDQRSERWSNNSFNLFGVSQPFIQHLALVGLRLLNCITFKETTELYKIFIGGLCQRKDTLEKKFIPMLTISFNSMD